MAEKFNLLPKNQEERQSSKTDKLLKKIAISSFVVSLLILAGLSSALFFFSNRLGDVDSEIKKNKTEVASLETAESGLAIAKDRAQKISSILELRKSEEVYKRYLKIIDSLPASVQIRDINLEDNETAITFIGSNSKDFSDFIDWLMINQNEFNVLYANSVGLDEDRGYVLSMEAN